MKKENTVLVRRLAVAVLAGFAAAGVAATRLDLGDPIGILLTSGIGILASMLASAVAGRN